jgi:hypothetical protein
MLVVLARAVAELTGRYPGSKTNNLPGTKIGQPSRHRPDAFVTQNSRLEDLFRHNNAGQNNPPYSGQNNPYVKGLFAGLI